MNENELKLYANKLSDEEIRETKAKIYTMANFRTRKQARVTIKRMAAYLVRIHPNLIVDLSSTTVRKDTTTRSSRLRTPGSIDYKGYHLKVWTNAKAKQGNWRYPNLINHDTTETYRYNAEVAEKIVEYEKRGKKR